MYTYKAKLDRVVDGDTIDVNIDLGFDISVHKRVRLAGINAPESRTRNLEEKKKGLAAKEYTKEMLSKNEGEFTIKSHGVGKYGRALATVLVESLSPLNGEDGITLIDVNKQLIEEGHAVEYWGGKR